MTMTSNSPHTRGTVQSRMRYREQSEPAFNLSV